MRWQRTKVCNTTTRPSAALRLPHSSGGVVPLSYVCVWGGVSVSRVTTITHVTTMNSRSSVSEVEMMINGGSGGGDSLLAVVEDVYSAHV